MLRLLCALSLFFLGGISAMAAVLVHADWWGAFLGWAVLAALIVATPGAWYGRPVFALGWILTLVGALGSRPEGDFLVASDLSGYALLASAPVLVVATLLGLSGRGRAPRGASELSGMG